VGRIQIYISLGHASHEVDHLRDRKRTMTRSFLFSEPWDPKASTRKKELQLAAERSHAAKVVSERRKKKKQRQQQILIVENVTSIIADRPL
jgi:hypothetical protein